MCLMSVCMILCVCDCEQKTHFKPDISTIDGWTTQLVNSLLIKFSFKFRTRKKKKEEEEIKMFIKLQF